MRKLLWLVVFGCVAAVPLSAQVVLGNGIDYGGGLIMNKHHIYFIWYGNWTGNTALTILPDMVMGLDHSAYFNTMTTYRDNHGESVSDDVSFNGQAFNY